MYVCRWQRGEMLGDSSLSANGKNCEVILYFAALCEKNTFLKLNTLSSVFIWIHSSFYFLFPPEPAGIGAAGIFTEWKKWACLSPRPFKRREKRKPFVGIECGNFASQNHQRPWSKKKERKKGKIIRLYVKGLQTMWSVSRTHDSHVWV